MGTKGKWWAVRDSNNSYNLLMINIFFKFILKCTPINAPYLAQWLSEKPAEPGFDSILSSQYLLA